MFPSKFKANIPFLSALPLVFVGLLERLHCELRQARRGHPDQVQARGTAAEVRGEEVHAGELTGAQCTLYIICNAI